MTPPGNDDSIISTQADWERVRDEFKSASDYRAFSARYSFNPTSRVRLTGQTLADSLPRATPGGPRWTIFEKAILDGRMVGQINQHAQQLGRQTGSRPEPDGDVFIALFVGYVTLEE